MVEKQGSSNHFMAKNQSSHNHDNILMICQVLKVHSWPNNSFDAMSKELMVSLDAYITIL